MSSQAVLERQVGERRRWKEELEKSRIEMEHQVRPDHNETNIKEYKRYKKYKKEADLKKDRLEVGIVTNDPEKYEPKSTKEIRARLRWNTRFVQMIMRQQN